MSATLNENPGAKTRFLCFCLERKKKSLSLAAIFVSMLLKYIALCSSHAHLMASPVNDS